MKQLEIFTLLEPTPSVTSYNVPTFFNTIAAKEPELSKYESESLAQEAVVLRAFQTYGKMTPLEVARKTNLNHDSAKRAVTCLTCKGKLVKTDEMVMEVFGKKNHLWQKS